MCVCVCTCLSVTEELTTSDLSFFIILLSFDDGKTYTLYPRSLPHEVFSHLYILRTPSKTTIPVILFTCVHLVVSV